MTGDTSDGPQSIHVGFDLSQRYSEFKVVFGIPDTAACCPMPILTYSIDSGAASAPVTLHLGKPDRIDVPVTGASSLDVQLVFPGGGTAAFGGAQGLGPAGQSQTTNDTSETEDY